MRATEFSCRFRILDPYRLKTASPLGYRTRRSIHEIHTRNRSAHALCSPLPSVGGSATRGSSKTRKTSVSLQLKNASAVERFGRRPNRLRSVRAPGCSINALNRYRLDQGWTGGAIQCAGLAVIQDRGRTQWEGPGRADAVSYNGCGPTSNPTPSG
jgi:hypothetical protein